MARKMARNNPLSRVSLPEPDDATKIRRIVMKCRTSNIAASVYVLLALVACGGDGNGGGSTVTYTLGGTISGLTGSGLVLGNNGADDLAVTANGAFKFAIPVPND